MPQDWIICYDATHGDDAYAVECKRCGTKQRFAIPVNLDMWLAAAKVFQKQHRKCKAMPPNNIKEPAR